MKVNEYFDNWSDILDFINIVECEATLFRINVIDIEVFYDTLLDKYKVEVIYEGRPEYK